MKKIKSIRVSHQQQSESYEFHAGVLGVLLSMTLPLPLAVLARFYEQTVKAFDDALKQIRESEYSKAIADADARRDNAWWNLRAMVTVSMNHFMEEITIAAHPIDILLRGHGDPTRLANLVETNILRNLIQDLEIPKNAARIQTMGLTDWVTELKAATDEFSTLFDRRADEQSVFVTGITKETRKTTEEAYRTIVSVINSGALGEIPNLDTAIDKINYHVDYHNSRIASRTP